MDAHAVALVMLVAATNLTLGGWIGWILGTTRVEKVEPMKAVATSEDEEWYDLWSSYTEKGEEVK